AFSRQRQFTADASHELRTPLAVLAAQADLALDQARRPEDYRSALREIHQQAQQMAQLLAELLMLARADSGPVDIDHEMLDLTALVADTIATLTPLAETSGVTLSASAHLSVLITGDQARLTQLIVNLVDNALKYTPIGGCVEVSVRAMDGRARLRVSDSGVGIAPEHLPHLFERFYRADAARSRDEGGAGLGLAICQWIASAHQGTIAVQSTPGEGTTFTVSLPLTMDRLAG
ncbi:MAG TPA: ATP-binding protein, partial [Chloroflexota bacterium]